MTTVELRDLAVNKGGADVVRGVDLVVDSGAVLALLGSSGSGKTTLLRVIAGLDEVSRGRVLFEHTDVTAAGPARRRVAFVFQEPVLFPRRSVGRNISFPLEVDHRPIDEIRLRVGAEARALGAAARPTGRAATKSGTACSRRASSSPVAPRWRARSS